MTMQQSSSHFSSSNPSLQISSMSVSPSLSSISSFDNNGVDPAQASLNRLQQIVGMLDTTLRLPSNARAFTIYLLGLAIVLAGAFLHIFVAAQIMQAQFTLSQLQEQYRSIEQQNGDIIFQIARDTNMERLHDRVIAKGYVPVQAREYVFAPAATAPVAMAPNAATSESAALANTPAQDAPVTAPADTTVARTSVPNQGGGQLAHWEEFWSSIWRSASGSASEAASSASASSGSIQSSQIQPANGTANFWAVWWEKATEQGSKLLAQFPGN